MTIKKSCSSLRACAPERASPPWPAKAPARRRLALFILWSLESLWTLGLLVLGISLGVFAPLREASMVKIITDCWEPSRLPKPCHGLSRPPKGFYRKKKIVYFYEPNPNSTIRNRQSTTRNQSRSIEPY
jgi:hypothetical protein